MTWWRKNNNIFSINPKPKSFLFFRTSWHKNGETTLFKNNSSKLLSSFNPIFLMVTFFSMYMGDKQTWLIILFHHSIVDSLLPQLFQICLTYDSLKFTLIFIYTRNCTYISTTCPVIMLLLPFHIVGRLRKVSLHSIMIYQWYRNSSFLSRDLLRINLLYVG